MERPRYVVITGVSSGIGYDGARYLVERGWHVFGSVRKTADGERVQSELGKRFRPLLFDVTDGGAIGTAVEQVAEQVGDKGLWGLVNNAGIAVAGPLMHLPIEEFRQQLEVNVVGQLRVTQAFLPLLGARKDATHPPGRIVNISSVSGRIVYPFLGPYAASKHALEALSDALRRELMIYGVDVIVIEPGSIKTPIWDKAGEMDFAPFVGTAYETILGQMQKTFVRQGQTGIEVEKVSELIWEALVKERPKSRYVLPRKWLSGWIIPRWLPDRWFDNIVARRLGIERKA
jgi:NAD(P)-dependent dehydrogenase (short-subunit alcohol dehydrogenase family)